MYDPQIDPFIVQFLKLNVGQRLYFTKPYQRIQDYHTVAARLNRLGDAKFKCEKDITRKSTIYIERIS